MIDAGILARNIVEESFGPFVGVPCSILTPLIKYIDDDPALHYYAATSEGEAMGLAAGFSLSGSTPVVMMQNSGLGNSVNPITSLQLIYHLPALLLISLRGEIGTDDAPEHKIMGRITDKLLELLSIPYEYLADSEEALRAQLMRIDDDVRKNQRPFAIIIRKNAVKEAQPAEFTKYPGLLSRKEAVESVLSVLKGKEAIVSTTGFISRELYAGNKSATGNFYMLGSMGHASSIALGIALQNKDKKVIVFDGDGALLMKMGTMATIGHLAPANFIHVLFDNESYESTGGQFCVSVTANFYKVAEDVGYKTSILVKKKEILIEGVKKALKTDGPHFIHIKISNSDSDAAERVALKPQEIKQNVMEFLRHE